MKGGQSVMLRLRLGAQCGVGIIEMLIAMGLGLLVAMAAAAMLVSSKQSYTAVDEAVRLQESGRFALELISRMVRQTGFVAWDRADTPIMTLPGHSPSITGLDASQPEASGDGLGNAELADDRRSDVLAVRFFGSSRADGRADGTIQNCAGFSVAAPSHEEADVGRGWSIFYTANSSTGVPELRCKYQGASGTWTSDALVQGVESFQVLYGIDTNGAGMPRCYLNARAIHALDAQLRIVGASDAERAADYHRKTNWKKVVAVKLALLIRATQGIRQDDMNTVYHLFGAEYSRQHAALDPGTRIDEASLPAVLRARQRKQFNLTVMLRTGPV